MTRDPYTEGHAQGYADAQSGMEFQPESDDQDYLFGYEDGWDSGHASMLEAEAEDDDYNTEINEW